MIRWPKNVWHCFKALLFLLGIALPLCAPGNVHARCGCYLPFMLDQISASQDATQYLRDTRPTPVPWSSLTAVTDMRPQTWSAKLARDLVGIWTALTTTSIQRTPCPRCPSHENSPNEP